MKKFKLMALVAALGMGTLASCGDRTMVETVESNLDLTQIIFLGVLFAIPIIAIILSIFEKDDDRHFTDHV